MAQQLAPQRKRRTVVTVKEETAVPQIVETMDKRGVGSVVVEEDDEPVGIVTDRDIALSLRESPDVEKLVARDVMTPDPVTIEAGTDVFHIISELDEAGVRRAPIVDEGGKLDGFVSLDDILLLLGREAGGVADLIEDQT